MVGEGSLSEIKSILSIFYCQFHRFSDHCPYMKLPYSAFDMPYILEIQVSQDFLGAIHLYKHTLMNTVFIHIPCEIQNIEFEFYNIDKR